MASEPSQAELLRRAIENRLLDLHTQIPAVVDSFNSTAQTVDVIVAVKRAIVTDDEAVRHEEIGVIRDVPVMFPRGGGFCMTWPLVKGDPVRLGFDEVYAGKYRDTGVVPSEPGFVGRFNLSSCVAHPGSGSDAQALQTVIEDTMVIGFDEPGLAQIHITKLGDTMRIKLGPDVSSRVALANLVAAKIQEIVDAINGATAALPAGTDAGEPGLIAIQSALSSFNVLENDIGAQRVFGQ